MKWCKKSESFNYLLRRLDGLFHEMYEVGRSEFAESLEAVGPHFDD